MDLQRRDWASSKSRAISERGHEVGRASWCGRRTCGQNSSRGSHVFGAGGHPGKSLSLGKRLKSGWGGAGWPGSLMRRPAQKLAIGTVHPCQGPGQFAFPQTGSLSIEIPLRLNGHLHLGLLNVTSR